MVKLLLGGSPCTYWSIAQKNNREVEASGQGWELFKNYLIAKEKFRPDFFLYENNKSAAQAIKEQISHELNAPLMYINSALVSAQNRERFYVFNGKCEQPKDQGILLKDILESGVVDREKSYCLKHQSGNARDYFKKHHTQIAFEPVRIGTIESGTSTRHDSKPFRVYSPYGKSVTIMGQAGGVGAKTGLYAVPVNTLPNGKCRTIKAQYTHTSPANILKGYTSTYAATGVAVPVDSETADSEQKVVYGVVDGAITYKNVQYPINLPDGYYIIRKLTPIECERLQTLPDDYTAGVSDTQRYKCLGNGWTAEVIIHILRNILKNVPRSEKLFVLSMYDGIATGRYCLEQLGFNNIEYHAYEIDKYAKKVAMKHYPDIVQLGDAFDVRRKQWAFHRNVLSGRRVK